MQKNKRKILNSILSFYIFIGFLVILAGTVLILSPLYPYIFYQINSEALNKEQQSVTQLTESLPTEKPNNESGTNNLPPIDTSLTKTNTLLIPSIKVVGAIHENSNAQKGLEQGVWRVGEWGNPINNDFAIILASHRYGYITWSSKFREQNSFYNLPKTKVGDTVQIIWEQRMFTYKIYKAEEGTKITDYKADLILYTCKYLNSDIRIFRYAKRVN